MLEREQVTEQKTAPPATAVAAGPKLTQDELTELLNEAIRQSGQAELRREQKTSLATLDDALSIAREVGLSEEHVLAAARELQKTKLRALKREKVRARRKLAFWGWLALTVAVGIIAALFGSWAGALTTLLLMAIPALFLAWRMLAAPVTDAEADQVDLPPVPGTCQVCGRPAVNPRSTLCEEHTYRK